MPVYIPIVSEFKADGIKKAVSEFKSLETAGAKASFAIKKAAVPAGVALAGLAAGAVDAAKAAAEDAAAAEKLATTLANTTGATVAQVAAVEKFITKTSMAAAVADDELRPAMQTLVTGTKDVAKAQDLMSLALDISAGTGKDLASVTAALSKGYNGNMAALKKLDPSLAKAIKAGASADEVFASLAGTFGGQAATAAGTAEGKMRSFGIAMGEAKESIGAAVLPLAEKLLPKLTELGAWISDHAELVTALAVGIGAVAASILVANAAMTAWNAVTAITAAINTATGASFSALWVATGVGVILAVIAAVAILQAKFNIFGRAIGALRNTFTTLWNGIKTGFGAMVDVVRGYANVWLGVFARAFNLIAIAWNNTIGGRGFTVPDWVPLIGGKGFTVPNLPTWPIPQLAEGGIVTGPTLALIGERGPEAVVPLNRYNGGGPTIVVQGALDPVAVARQIRDILNRDARMMGRTAVL